MIRYIDTHFHSLHMISKGMHAKELFDTLQLEGFAGGIDAGTHHSDIQTRRKLLQDVPGVLCSGGIHPGAAGRYPFDELLSGIPVLYDAAASGDISCIGECGIDLYHRTDTIEEQIELFTLQLQASRKTGLPVIIHNRDADEQVLTLLKRYPPTAGGIMHCFSSDSSTALQALDMGLHISFAGNVTYPKNKELREALKIVPKERLLLETDSPFLSPVPERGSINHPGKIVHTYSLAAEVLGISMESLSCQVIEAFSLLTGEIS